MQLPPSDELVLVSGGHPILAKKARYFEDRRLQERIQPPPPPAKAMEKEPMASLDDWSASSPVAMDPKPATDGSSGEDPGNGGIRRELTLPEHEAITREIPQPADPFAMLSDEADDEPAQATTLRHRIRIVARQAALDRGDDLWDVTRHERAVYGLPRTRSDAGAHRIRRAALQAKVARRGGSHCLIPIPGCR
jgi:type IV secretion system protein VirD4